MRDDRSGFLGVVDGVPRRALIDALKPLVGSIDVTTMREANLRASDGSTSPSDVARSLWERITQPKQSQ